MINGKSPYTTFFARKQSENAHANRRSSHSGLLSVLDSDRDYGG